MIGQQVSIISFTGRHTPNCSQHFINVWRSIAAPEAECSSQYMHNIMIIIEIIRRWNRHGQKKVKEQRWNFCCCCCRYCRCRFCNNKNNSSSSQSKHRYTLYLHKIRLIMHERQPKTHEDYIMHSYITINPVERYNDFRHKSLQIQFFLYARTAVASTRIAPFISVAILTWQCCGTRARIHKYHNSINNTETQWRGSPTRCFCSLFITLEVRHE